MGSSRQFLGTVRTFARSRTKFAFQGELENLYINVCDTYSMAVISVLAVYWRSVMSQISLVRRVPAGSGVHSDNRDGRPTWVHSWDSLASDCAGPDEHISRQFVIG